MKKLIILFLILISSVFAQQGNVYILGLHYEDNDLLITNVLHKPGFFPDRKLQLETGNTLDMISLDDEVLYSFKFGIPNKVYTDVINEGEIEGGLIILNETDFALVLPYFDNLKEIRISGLNDEELVSHNFQAPALSPNNRFVFSLLIVLALIVAVVLIYRKKI